MGIPSFSASIARSPFGERGARASSSPVPQPSEATPDSRAAVPMSIWGGSTKESSEATLGQYGSSGSADYLDAPSIFTTEPRPQDLASPPVELGNETTPYQVIWDKEPTVGESPEETLGQYGSPGFTDYSDVT